MTDVPRRVLTDEYGNTVSLSISGDGHRAHLNVADADGTDVIAYPPHAPPANAPRPTPSTLGYLSRGGGFWTPSGARKLAHLLLQWTDGRAAADAALREARRLGAAARGEASP